jgi:hypothetical protein
MGLYLAKNGKTIRFNDLRVCLARMVFYQLSAIARVGARLSAIGYQLSAIGEARLLSDSGTGKVPRDPRNLRPR